MKKVIAIMGAALILLSLMATALVPLAVQADEPDDTDGSSSSSSTPEPANDGGLELTGYELKDINSADQKIHMNTQFTLVLHLSDKREEVLRTWKPENTPQIRLNSSSFFISAGTIEAVTDTPPITDLQMRGDRLDYTVTYFLSYTGTGNALECDVYYLGLDAVPYATISLNINKVVEYQEPDSSSSDSESSSITRGTNFVVKSASYGTGTVAAGAPFKLSIEAMTTNGTYAVDNITATLALPKEITFTSGTSTIYVGSAAPNTTFSAVFDLMASAVAEEGSYTLTLTIDGVDAQSGEKVSDTTELTVPVYQPERFEILSKTLPDFLNAGSQDMGYASVTLINKGIGDVYNVTVGITGGDLYFAEGEVYLGSIKGNSQSSADFVIMSDTPGTYEATLVVRYENSLGEEKTLTSNFPVTVAEGGMPIDEFPIDDMPVEEPKGISPLVWVGVGVAAVAAGVVVAVVLAKRRKKKKDAELDDDYEDDDA